MLHVGVEENLDSYKDSLGLLCLDVIAVMAPLWKLCERKALAVSQKPSRAARREFVSVRAAQTIPLRHLRQIDVGNCESFAISIVVSNCCARPFTSQSCPLSFH